VKNREEERTSTKIGREREREREKKRKEKEEDAVSSTYPSNHSSRLLVLSVW
jgi:hypothetical protein